MYLPAAQENDPGKFNTQVEIKLKEWSRKLLPETAIKIAKQTLTNEFVQILTNDSEESEHSGSFAFKLMKISKASFFSKN